MSTAYGTPVVQRMVIVKTACFPDRAEEKQDSNKPFAFELLSSLDECLIVAETDVELRKASAR